MGLQIVQLNKRSVSFTALACSMKPELSFLVKRDGFKLHGRQLMSPYFFIVRFCESTLRNKINFRSPCVLNFEWKSHNKTIRDFDLPAYRSLKANTALLLFVFLDLFVAIIAHNIIVYKYYEGIWFQWNNSILTMLSH